MIEIFSQMIYVKAGKKFAFLHHHHHHHNGRKNCSNNKLYQIKMYFTLV